MIKIILGISHWSLVLMILGAPIITAAAQGNRPKTTASEISVHLTIPRKTFRVGEKVIVTVYISNVSDKPILVRNRLSELINPVSYIEFKVSDHHGRESPSLEANLDIFSPPAKANPAIALLRSWVLLYPGYSLVGDITLGRELFAFLGKPGKYRLSGTYFSSGLFYPSAYREIGLTEEDVKSLPFQSWGGHISTNTLNIEIVPVSAHQPGRKIVR